ncbi:4-coumarate-CoA ligase [Thozetella sp. PMI_491]|nr:4-coumarate-CoA ligase [Thozetella sp. PMI_491]
MAPKTVYNAAVDYEIDDIDLLSLIFDSPKCQSDEDTILHVEAALPSNFVTKSDTRRYTKNIAHILRARYGVGASGAGKDVVVCISTGQVLLPSMFYGTIAAGGIYSSASSSFTVMELASQLRQGSAMLLITSPDCESVARQAAKLVCLQPDRIIVLGSSGGIRSLKNHKNEDLLTCSLGYQQDWEVVRDKETLKSQPICLLYSSGTTGPPKGVILSHQNLVANGMAFLFSYRAYEARCKQREPSYKFEYRTVAHLPTAHIAGVQGYFVHPAVVAGPVFWMAKFDFPKFLEYNKMHRATTFFSVPPIYLQIAQSPLVTDQFAGLQHAVSGAAPMGPELTARAEKKLGCAISQTWGLSEAAGAVTVRMWDEVDHTGSISPLLANLRMRLLDNEENDVDSGQVGEFVIQGPTITPGYWNNPEATTSAFTRCGEWFKTGDLGCRRDGKFFIVDRKKEMIKYKGLQVAPAELEALLLSHPNIKDAAVIGVPDPNIPDNEVPRAYVVADPKVVSEDNIKVFVKRQLAQHKQLRGGVLFLDAIPKSANGKILRRQLKDLARNGVMKPVLAKL